MYVYKPKNLFVLSSPVYDTMFVCATKNLLSIYQAVKIPAKNSTDCSLCRFEILVRKNNIDCVTWGLKCVFFDKGASLNPEQEDIIWQVNCTKKTSRNMSTLALSH